MASSDAKSLKRIPQKKHFPFGTPTNKFHPFSEFQHLKPEDVLLYKALSANEGEFKAEIFTGDEITSKTSPKKKKVAPIKIDTDILKDIPNVPAGVEPCKRIDCKNVIKNILESQSRNSIERDELMLDIENHLAEYQSSERENAAMENKLDHANRLTSQLEATLQHLNAQIDRLEGKKVELQQEKEELGNKAMVTETEKQNCIHLLQLAEKALADAMWRGKHADPHVPPEVMPILKKDASEVDDLHSVANTSYQSLATSQVVDFSERPKGSAISSVADYLKHQLIPQSSQGDFWETASNRTIVSQFKLSSSQSGVWSKHSQTRMLQTASATPSTVLTRPTLGPHLMPLSSTSEEKVRKKIEKIHRDTHPFLELPPDAFRGYTPTGSPTFRRGLTGGTFRLHGRFGSTGSVASAGGQGLDDGSVGSSSLAMSRLTKSVTSMNMSRSLSSLGADVSLGFTDASFGPGSRARPWDQLDPIFYDNRRPSTFSKGETLGRQRVREGAAAGQYTKLLTNKHPGLLSGMTMKSLQQSTD